MRCFILIFCLVQFQVHANNDWLNRTVRVDLIVNSRRTFDPKYDLLEQSEERFFTSGVDATNGQYPWSILTIAWSDQGTGRPCSGSIISNNFGLSDLRCVGQDFDPPANSIETYIGSVRHNFQTPPTNFIRTYWYIASSAENTPNIVLLRFNETLTFNPNIHPIQLPSYENFTYEGWSSFILGLGPPDGPINRRLQSTHASILNNSLCIFPDTNADDHEICGIEGSDPSESGPIINYSFRGGAWIVFEYKDLGLEFHPVIIGIHQYQFANQTASFGYATRVSHFVEWIETLAVDSEK